MISKGDGGEEEDRCGDVQVRAKSYCAILKVKAAKDSRALSAQSKKDAKVRLKLK